MSVAEKLKTEGRVEGLKIGKIQILEEFLDLPMSSGDALKIFSLSKLKTVQAQFHLDYELRFSCH